MRYAAFISYNHRDRKVANWLHRTLETYRIPARLRGRDSAFGPLGARLPPIFQDREELSASADLAASVRQALEQTHALIVVCSPSGARSKWVNEEIRAFTALGRRNHIHCLIVDGEPNASRLSGMDAALECLPPALFENGGSEPLASDIRPGQDGHSAARLKLLAAIMGIGYDELRNREQQRRQKWLLLVASASAIGFIAMAGLAVLALISRADAVHQRDVAREKTATAERTVEFVKSLFTVSDPSEAKGAKVTAKEVLDKGAVRIAQSLNDEPNVKAELMTTLSEVYQGLGVFHRGDELIRKSLRLPVSDVGVRARQYVALAASDYRAGNYEKAVGHYRIALTHAQRLPDPNPPLVASILAAMGDSKSQAGTYPDAEQDIRKALAIDLAQLGPHDPAVARDLEALAFYQVGQKAYPKARANFERALEIRIVRQGPAHPQVADDLDGLGAVAYLEGDSVAAETYYKRGLQSDQIVLGPDHPELALTANNLGRVMIERREFAAAEPLLSHAVAITLAQRDPDNGALAFLYDNLALAERGLGQVDRAEQLLRQGLRVAELHKHRNRAPIMTDLADLLCRRGASQQGLAMLAAAEPIGRQDYPVDPWRWAWTANTRGDCLVRSGERKVGFAILTDSMPALRKRWPAGSMYRQMAEDRLKAASGPLKRALPRQ